MTGLEILETTQEINAMPFISVALLIMLVFAAFASIVGVAKGSPNFKVAKIGCVVGILTGFLCFCFAPDSLAYETIYKVAITEELNYKEFTEKYEVISVKDDLYTVKEK